MQVNESKKTKLREKKAVYQCRGWGPPLVGGVTEPTKVEGQQRGTSHAPPPQRIQHRPDRRHMEEKENTEKEKNTKNRRGFLLVSKSVLIQLQTTQPDCSRHQSAMNRLIFRLRQSTKEGEPKLHVNILMILVTAAESCKNHRQQTGQWQAEGAFTSSVTHRGLLLK